MESKRYTLNRADLDKILNGLLVALIGAAVTYLTQVVTQVDFGSWTPMVVTLAAVGANVVRKFLDGK